MIKAIRRISAVLLAVALVAPAGLMTAHAADDYQASVVASISLDVDCPVAVGSSARAVAVVATDGARAALGGQVSFAVNGDPVTSAALDGNNRAQATIPAGRLPKGDHTLRATYQPPAGSDLQEISTETLLVVNESGSGACVAGSDDDQQQSTTPPDNGGTDGPKAGQTPSNGLLPNTGGFWLGLLVIAVIALAAGFALVRRSRNA